MLDVYWVGSAKKELLACPEAIRKRIGFQLYKLQNGHLPDDYKPMSSIGKGVFEIRTGDGQGNNVGRCIYTKVVNKRVYVLHVFLKKSSRTPYHNIELARARLRQLKKDLQKVKESR